MTASFCWEPAKATTVGNFETDLRLKLEGAGRELERIWSEDDLPYLQGLLDGGVEGAEEMIVAITKYGKIRTWREY